MKGIIKFQIRNPNFSIERANEFHGGQESDGNKRIEWLLSYKTPITEFKIDRNEGMSINSFRIDNLTILDCYHENNETVGFIISNEIIDKIITNRNKQRQTITITFELLPNKGFQQLPNSYIFLSSEKLEAYLRYRESLKE